MDKQDFFRDIPVRLDDQQTEAVQASTGPVLLLAVPGSGKTTVLVARLGYLIFCCGVDPASILTMTYTVSATGDMRRRFAALFGRELAERLEFRTINGVSARVIRYYERVCGRRAFRLVTDERALAAILGESYRRHAQGFASDSTLRALRTKITYVKNQMLDEKALEKITVDDVPLSPVYRDYCAALRERGWMDYDDQMVYALQILLHYPEILEAFRQKYRHLCVDEAQDTSRIQHRILHLLAQGSESLFLVGDEDQSIYGFRAACPEALLRFGQDYPGGRILLMERNYRSARPIVEAADRFIRQNRDRHLKHMISTQGEGPAVRALPVFDRTAQYRYLLNIAKSCKSETAVLYRNNESALPVIDLLEREGIPYRCRQFDGSFFSNRVIRDLTDILRFALDPANRDVFLRIYFKLNAGISKAAAEYAVKQPGNRPLLETLQTAPELPQRTAVRCKALQTHLEHMRDEAPDKAVYRIVRFMGYGEYLDQRGLDAGKAEILEAIGRPEPTIQRLLARLEELESIVRTERGEPDCPFLLSTIHSSKGLEYDRVILMDVLDGVFPNVEQPAAEHLSEEDRKALEEERRIFYVGMTRAKRELQIFRFQRTSLSSSFTDVLFPPAGKPVKPMPKPAASQSPAVDPDRFAESVRVCHRQFGEGVITVKQGDIVTIRFDSGEERRFSLHTALRRGQLLPER